MPFWLRDRKVTYMLISKWRSDSRFWIFTGIYEYMKPLKIFHILLYIIYIIYIIFFIDIYDIISNYVDQAQLKHASSSKNQTKASRVHVLCHYPRFLSYFLYINLCTKSDSNFCSCKMLSVCIKLTLKWQLNVINSFLFAFLFYCTTLLHF